ncbi:hypothetical protein RSOL_479280, partial [Rhizoctonia solani AG-3 Rhs1AP]
MTSETLPVNTIESQLPSTALDSNSDIYVEEQLHDDTAIGYLVSVFHHYSEPPPPAPPGRGRPPGPKKDHVVKSDRMRLDTMTRYEVATACLSVHNLEDEYRASKVLGFKFKMWWTGSSGGKSGASTIETDADYEIARDQLLASKRSSKDMVVFISFDTDQMDAFRRVHKRPGPSDLVDATVDLRGSGVGTKVPRLAEMDAPSQLHSEQILKLKETHQCEEHRGEHGEPGFCYVAPNGAHIGLNMRRFAIWGAAIAAGDATRHVPPNVPEFDGPHGLGPTTTRPRGRGSATQAAPVAAPPTSPSNPSSIFIAALLPLILSLTQSAIPRPLAPVPAPVASILDNTSSTIEPLSELPEPGIATSFPFLPTHTMECILAFKDEVGVDIIDKLGVLDHRDLTPNIIHEVPHEHLAGILGLSEGKAIKFQMFCRWWTREFSQKLKQKEIV